MWHTQEVMTPAAVAIVRWCLELTGVDLRDFGDDYWTHDFPRSARVLTRPQAVEMLDALLDALRSPETYQLTDYDWLLLYETLRGEVADLNDCQLPEFNREVARLRRVEDRSYVQVLRAGTRVAQVLIDFDRFLDRYFWDLDFLLSDEVVDGLTPDQKRSLGPNPELFGLLHGLTPAPEELRLRPVPPDGVAETDL
jgi:hypothetical protein